ncbi:hypothetical protein LQV63_08840 [Paenibacillus profundus]|uniref:Uncharacterized protein n=1 Tax=Paenibacillus profundus TaxID=1173085 RepID=A0ABS8YGZ6_9BACL|nr:hypothetical protein [Paenibacillus profundus]MCE5169417.1 hypothetical protein [Paenibacillus profundus]
MSYALINLKGEAIEICEDPIENTNPAFEVVKIHDFTAGDELNYFIVVIELRDSEDEQDEEPYRIATSYSAIRQTATVARLRVDNEKLQQENAALILQVASLEMSNQQLTQDHASLLFQLAEKGVL